jgi:uncharacterized protein YigA (DUF484 family)
MSSAEQVTTSVAESNEDAIADYLQAHPDFFERNGSLLTILQLPHSTGGAAISLIERQVSVLRQQNRALEKKLRNLVEVARGNDELAEKIHALSIQLMSTETRDEAVEILERQLLTGFSVDRAVLVLFVNEETASEPEGRFLRLVKREDPVIGSFKTFLNTSAARCGSVRDAQRNFLFGSDNIDVGSVALVPLGKKSELGFLAFGSHDADHFHPGKSIDFLTRLGDLVAGVLQNRD